MIIWFIKETFVHGISRHKKGNYLITANYRAPWYSKYPVENVGSFQAYWGARPCVIELTQKQAESWIKKVVDNSNKLKKKIQLKGISENEC